MKNKPGLAKLFGISLWKRSFFVTLIMIYSVCGFCQDNEEKKIYENFQKQVECWNKGDIDCYVSLYAPEDSVRMLYSTGAVYGRDSILAFYKKYWPKERMGTLNFTDIRVEKLSDIFYFASGFFHVQIPGGKTASGRFTCLMKKINGRWYIYTDHSG